MLNQSGVLRSIVSVITMLVAGLGVALTFLSVGAGFGTSAATARADIAIAEQTVNHAAKGDRLVRASAPPIADRFPDRTPARSFAPDARLADGCESLVSPLTKSQLARVAGRCVS